MTPAASPFVKILHVIPSFGLGGMEKVVCTLINNTLDCYAHAILTLDKYTPASQWIKDEKVQFIDFDKSNERGRFFWALHCVLQKIQPDLLMTYNWGATDAIWLGRCAGIRSIIHSEHGFNVDEGEATCWKRDLIRFFVYRLASQVIIVSRELQTILQRRYFLRASHVKRIPNGIDTSYYSPNLAERQRVRKTLGFEDNNVVVGFSGRLDPIKNLGLLLDIFAHCVRENPHLRLLIVGDGPEKKNLETLCQEKNIYNHTIFTGQQENVLPYLRAMEVFLLPSLREQMPLTVLEAMAVGIPVVATKVGEIPQIIDDGINGFVRDVGAPIEAFAQSLRALLVPARRRDMGEAARRKIVNNFQEQTMIQRYKTIIQELL